MNRSQEITSPSPEIRRWKMGRYGIMAAGLVFAMVAMPCMWYIDPQITSLLPEIDLPGDFEKAIQISEVFAHGSGVIAILATLWWIDVPRRRILVYASGMTLLSSVVANSLKVVFSRVRPHSSDLVNSSESWLPLFHGSFWESAQRSFPSGHSATAVGLAIGLSIVYPRGTVLFALFAALACTQRVVSQAHYPSDVLAGITIACLCCSIMMIWPPRGL